MIKYFSVAINKSTMAIIIYFISFHLLNLLQLLLNFLLSLLHNNPYFLPLHHHLLVLNNLLTIFKSRIIIYDWYIMVIREDIDLGECHHRHLHNGHSHYFLNIAN